MSGASFGINAINNSITNTNNKVLLPPVLSPTSIVSAQIFTNQYILSPSCMTPSSYASIVLSNNIFNCS